MPDDERPGDRDALARIGGHFSCLDLLPAENQATINIVSLADAGYRAFLQSPFADRLPI